MNSAKVVHTILKISHVTEEVFRHFASRLDDARWGDGRAIDCVGCMVLLRRRWMPD